MEHSGHPRQNLVVIDVVKGWPEEFGRKLLAGERAFPPETCGRIGCYEECVEVAARKKRDPERLRWLDGWKSEKIDFKETERLFYQVELILEAHYDEM